METDVYSLMVQTGLDRAEKLWPKRLRDSRLGFLVHPASVDKQFDYELNVFRKSKNFGLKALFGPQHGIWSEWLKHAADRQEKTP